MRIEVGPGESIERALTRAHEQAREEDGMNAASFLYREHRRAKHSDSCWKCDAPWPCLTIAALIDADHDWALWHDERRVKELEAEVERLKAERDAAWRVRDAGWEQTEEALRQKRRAEERLAKVVEVLKRGLRHDPLSGVLADALAAAQPEESHNQSMESADDD